MSSSSYSSHSLVLSTYTACSHKSWRASSEKSCQSSTASAKPQNLVCWGIPSICGSKFPTRSSKPVSMASTLRRWSSVRVLLWSCGRLLSRDVCLPRCLSLGARGLGTNWRLLLMTMRRMGSRWRFRRAMTGLIFC